MPKRALIEHRPYLLASVIAATAYYFLADQIKVEMYSMALKGAGVGLLAIYAAHRGRGIDGVILFAVMALCALADMVLEWSMTAGGALFALAHVVAVVLYLRARREVTTKSQMLLGAVLLVVTPALSYLLSSDPMVAVYAIPLGAMAATAWTSRFPRYRVGIGAVLFVVSDLLIFSRMGGVDLAPLPDLLVWPFYYIGQLMIATGVVQTLRGEQVAH